MFSLYLNRGADRKATAQLGAQQWRLYRNQTNYLPATANAMGRLTASNHAFNITPDSSSLLQKEWDSPIPSEARELDFAHALQCSCHNKAGSVLFLVTGPAFNSQEKPSFISHGILTLQSWCEASGEEPLVRNPMEIQVASVNLCVPAAISCWLGPHVPSFIQATHAG